MVTDNYPRNFIFTEFSNGEQFWTKFLAMVKWMVPEVMPIAINVMTKFYQMSAEFWQMVTEFWQMVAEFWLHNLTI
jgi:hypothetical protein